MSEETLKPSTRKDRKRIKKLEIDSERKDAFELVLDFYAILCYNRTNRG